MVQSILNSSVNYVESKYIDKNDINYKAPLYELKLYIAEGFYYTNHKL